MFLCVICRKRSASSEEHLPPRSAGNAEAVIVRYHHLASRPGEMAETMVEMSHGFTIPTLCEKCNNHVTGSRYGPAYAEFSKQFIASSGLRDPSGKRVVVLKSIYPQRVIKQMYSMFLSIQPSGGAEKWDELRTFVRMRNAPPPIERPRVFLFWNNSRDARISPLIGLCRPLDEVAAAPPIVHSELSWQRLGIIFSVSRFEFFSELMDVSDWAYDEFKTRCGKSLLLPILPVTSSWPLAFGTRRDVKHWIDRTMFLTNVSEYSGELSGLPALIRPK